MHWLSIKRGNAPLLVSIPHTGIEIPEPYTAPLHSIWLARKDADWHIDTLYDFAADYDATIVHTAISRTVIDVNRDPSGQSLYPGQATTELCPTTTFDGEPLYRDGHVPDAASIAERKSLYFDPYHAALAAEIRRLRALHQSIVLYDCHSIRSVIPRLFEGTLPNLNLGTNSGASCAPQLAEAVLQRGAASPFTQIHNGRFKGGFITRNFGKPSEGVHAVQMEMACRTYMNEPLGAVDEQNWPQPYDASYAAPARALLKDWFGLCLDFAKTNSV
jgi:N-formylglutamate deformylase